ncbi:MAG: hypothetical protein ACSLFR_17725 [Solirubrobacteraceae bacterium]
MSAMVLGIIAVGVMSGFDVSARNSGDAKHKAAAANIAENEIERMRSLRISELTAMTGTPQTVSQNGVSYTRTAKAEWVSQPATGSICEVAGPPTYLRLSVSVSWPGRSSNPVSVTSLLAPGARGTLSTQGALVIRITDINGNGVAGVPVTVGGGVPAGSTDSNGCVSWSPITAATYDMSFSKAGYMTTDGSASVAESISVAGQEVTQRSYTYSQGGTISGTFSSTRSAVSVPSSPTRVAIAHPSRATQYFNVTSGSFNVSVPPDAQPYTVYAGNCAAARPPVAYETNATVGPGANVSVNVRMPALDVVTQVRGANANGTVKVTDVCGTVYSRPTTAASGGKLADPGFPYSASSISVCTNVYYGGGGVGAGNYKFTGSSTNGFPGATSVTRNFDYYSYSDWGWCPLYVPWCTYYAPDSGWSSGTC